MHPRYKLALPLTIAGALALAMVLFTALAVHRISGVADEQMDSTHCPTITLKSDVPGFYGVLQAAVSADRDYPLYIFDGVSERPRQVGLLGKGEQFCFRKDATVIDLTADDPLGNAIPIGIIETENWPDGVYSTATKSLPTVSRGDGRHRVAMMRYPLAVRADGGQPLDFARPPMLGDFTDDVAPLTVKEVSVLSR